jgi:hypothetical protein
MEKGRNGERKEWRKEGMEKGRREEWDSRYAILLSSPSSFPPLIS